MLPTYAPPRQWLYMISLNPRVDIEDVAHWLTEQPLPSRKTEGLPEQQVLYTMVGGVLVVLDNPGGGGADILGAPVLSVLWEGMLRPPNGKENASTFQAAGSGQGLTNLGNRALSQVQIGQAPPCRIRRASILFAL